MNHLNRAAYHRRVVTSWLIASRLLLRDPSLVAVELNPDDALHDTLSIRRDGARALEPLVELDRLGDITVAGRATWWPDLHTWGAELGDAIADQLNAPTGEQANPSHKSDIAFFVSQALELGGENWHAYPAINGFGGFAGIELNEEIADQFPGVWTTITAPVTPHGPLSHPGFRITFVTMKTARASVPIGRLALDFDGNAWLPNEPMPLFTRGDWPECAGPLLRQLGLKNADQKR